LTGPARRDGFTIAARRGFFMLVHGCAESSHRNKNALKKGSLCCTSTIEIVAMRVEIRDKNLCILFYFRCFY
jgi:hypothetical protein